MRAAFCNSLFRMFGHRVCCSKLPEWTAHVGQRWDVYDVAPWNLYNVIWRIRNWIACGMTD